MRLAILSSVFVLCGCVTEAEHIHPTVLPTGKPGYVITCNSQRYDRCLNRAARACNGAYTTSPAIDAEPRGASTPLMKSVMRWMCMTQRRSPNVSRSLSA